MEITEVLTAPRSFWQSPYVGRVIGSIRRECLDHVVVMNESSLPRQIACYLAYYTVRGVIFYYFWCYGRRVSGAMLYPLISRTAGLPPALERA
jgi:hypothetical protein